MKSILKLSAVFFVVICLFVACQGDGSAAQESADSDNVENIDNSLNANNHDGHDHAGHDHGNNANTNKSTGTDDRINAQLEEGKGLVSSEEWAKKKAQAVQGTPERYPIQSKNQGANSKLPSTCYMITTEKIADIVGADADLITIKDGSGRSNPHSQSCFFRWEHRGNPNSGVMIQIQDNPLPDEFPDWAKYYIQAKVNQGEQMPDGSASYKYKTMDGVGDAGCYNYELNRYVWRVGSDYIFMVAFNLYASENEQLKWAKAIGNEVMKNF